MTTIAAIKINIGTTNCTVDSLRMCTIVRMHVHTYKHLIKYQLQLMPIGHIINTHTLTLSSVK